MINVAMFDRSASVATISTRLLSPSAFKAYAKVSRGHIVFLGHFAAELNDGCLFVSHAVEGLAISNDVDHGHFQPLPERFVDVERPLEVLLPLARSGQDG